MILFYVVNVLIYMADPKQSRTSVVVVIVTVVLIIIFMLTWNKSVFTGRKRIDFTDRINKLLELQEKNLAGPGIEPV